MFLYANPPHADLPLDPLGPGQAARSDKSGFLGRGRLDGKKRYAAARLQPE